MQFDEVLRTFQRFFDREGVRYALIGGLAMQAWGRSRMTKDVDIAVDRSSQERVLAFTEELGYELLHVSKAYSNHAHSDARRGRIDFMYLAGETAERVFGAASERPIVGDVVFPVTSRSISR